MKRRMSILFLEVEIQELWMCFFYILSKILVNKIIKLIDISLYLFSRKKGISGVFDPSFGDKYFWELATLTTSELSLKPLVVAKIVWQNLVLLIWGRTSARSICIQYRSYSSVAIFTEMLDSVRIRRGVYKWGYYNFKLLRKRFGLL